METTGSTLFVLASVVEVVHESHDVQVVYIPEICRVLPLTRGDADLVERHRRGSCIAFPDQAGFFGLQNERV